MPGPGPRLKTSAQPKIGGSNWVEEGEITTRNMQRDIRLMKEACDGVGFSEGANPSDDRQLQSSNTACRAAGLACDWPTLRARAKAINQTVYGYFASTANTPEMLDWRKPHMLRAWAVVYAPDLIGATAEQPVDGFDWW